MVDILFQNEFFFKIVFVSWFYLTFLPDETDNTYDLRCEWVPIMRPTLIWTNDIPVGKCRQVISTSVFQLHAETGILIHSLAYA